MTDAAPRDVRFWRVTVPDDVESWFLSLEPSVGEAMMAIRRELLGNSDAVSSTSDSSSTSGARRQKTGYELFYKYPTSSQATLTPGTYYVAVGAEGQAPHSSSYIGTGPTTYTLTSHGEAELRGGADTLLPADTPLAWHGETLRYGEQRAYRFTVPAGVLSMEIRLTTASGYPRYTVAHPTTANGPFPNPSESYGASEGGGSSVTGGDGIVTLVEPSGVYTILVVARSGADGEVGAVYDLDVVARGEGVIPFNGGVASVTDHESQTWRYFRVDVPAGALGWDLRIRNVQSGNPRLVVKRDDSPTSVSSTTYFPYYFDEWRTGYQWAAGTDITGRTYAPRVDGQPNVNESGHTVTMGMGSPLEPGSYVVGVTDPGGQTGAPMAYEIESRGIGVGDDADGQPWRIQVGELAFDGGVATVDALPAREIAYYRVDVPPGAATWGLELDPTTPGGEGLLAVRKDNPPNSYANASRSDETGNPSGTRRQRAGGELFYKYPDSGDAALDGGAYYVAVASEGVAPYSTGYVGAGAVSFELRSVGVLPVVQADHELGLDAPVAFLGESLPAGAQRTYRFTVPEGVTLMEVRLENTTGAPSAAVSLMPVPFPNPRDSGYVAAEGGGATVATGTDLMNVADPLGTYTVIVAANPSGAGDVGATYDLTITARGERPLAFNGGVAAVTAQEPGTWRYFRVTVPDDGQLGWDLAIENVQSGRPQLVARRDELPTSVSSTSNLVNGSTWRTGYQLAASTDITNRAYPPRQPSNNVYEGGRRFTVGMNAPLEPGTYVVGVIDQSSNAEPASYELVSRTVGVGTDADGEPWTWQVADLAFDGGAVSLVGLEPREVRYFRVQVPPGARSWEVDLDPALGEAMLAVNVDAIPSSFASGVSVLPGGNRQGARRQKAGPERYYRYPRSAERAIDGGTFYLAVAAEGQDPYNASYIGTGPTDVTLTSVGEAPEVGAGSVVTAATPVRYAAQTLAYGEERIYHVRVPDELPSFEVRLEGVAGRPEYAVGLYDFFADSVPSISTTYRASDGGTSTIATGTLSSEVVGRHGDVTIVVGADDLSGVPADATFDLVVQGGGVGALAFDGGQVSAAIVDRATRTYRVDIPQDCDAVPAAGWVLGLEVRSGTAQLRVRKDRLPGEPAGGTTLTTSARETVLAPPFFAPGIWYVTVAATGLTDFTLTSRPVAAERVWAMPVAGEAPAAPGLAAPVFADTGVDPDGAPHVNPSTGGPGVDLGQDRYHYYRVTVPPGNGGFWRTQLEAISGNPNLYIRRDAAPTLNHGSSGTGGSLYDWYDTQTGSSYGHWAVANSRTDGAALPPGEYWIAVTAVG
ncbi:MAG: hypothetical protein KC635_01610, partial [Myxococcales bacterium]|nr:hypothetical protein [Myxococcales bacterium]